MNKFLLLVTFSVITLSAELLTVGAPVDILDAYEYETPKGVQIKIPHPTKLIIIAFSKKTGAIVNDLVEGKEKYYFQNKDAVFITDIHKMPRFITNMFTLPKLKKYEHQIYLHYGKVFEDKVPHKDEQITIFRIKDRKVVSLEFISLVEELEAVLNKD